MLANVAVTENELARNTARWLRDRLPASWEVGPTGRAEFRTGPDSLADMAIDVKAPNGTFVTLAVEARVVFGPRDVAQLVNGVTQTLRKLAAHTPIIVSTSWLSERSQELLQHEGINYLDLTGNAYLRIDNPTVFIQTEGAARNPRPPPRGRASAQGPRAYRLLRTLTDVVPPYRLRDLATATGLAPGYVSRLLDTLDDVGLIGRRPRGPVETVDVERLIRWWAQTYDVFPPGRTSRYLARAGAGAAMAALKAVDMPTAVTGSFAAVRLAPVAGPALLAIYTESPREVAAQLDLIPTDDGANVVLLTPFDPVIWDHTTVADGVTFVAPAQVAVDCLTGNGRMPAEGAAVLTWMSDHPTDWRTTSLPDRTTRTTP